MANRNNPNLNIEVAGQKASATIPKGDITRVVVFIILAFLLYRLVSIENEAANSLAWLLGIALIVFLLSFVFDFNDK